MLVQQLFPPIKFSHLQARRLHFLLLQLLLDGDMQGQMWSPVDTVAWALLMPVWIVSAGPREGNFHRNRKDNGFYKTWNMFVRQGSHNCSARRACRVAAEALLMISGL